MLVWSLLYAPVQTPLVAVAAIGYEWPLPRHLRMRRAVKLLESGEAREILRHYGEEPEFRDQVNRYVHDFEAMLRRILADRDGTALGVTLLSSDMGKLYVALAQAIERIRK